MMAEVTVTDRVYGSHGSLKIEMGRFISPSDAGNYVVTKLGQVLYLEFIPLTTTATGATTDQSITIRINRRDVSATPENSFGSFAWNGTEAAADGTYAYICYGF